MQSISAASFGQNQVTLGCFEVSGRTYAVDVTYVREVVRWQPVTPLPKAPALIEGVIDLRGAVVPGGRSRSCTRRRPASTVGESHARIAVERGRGPRARTCRRRGRRSASRERAVCDGGSAESGDAGGLRRTARAVVRRPDADPISCFPSSTCSRASIALRSRPRRRSNDRGNAALECRIPARHPEPHDAWSRLWVC